MFESGPEGEKAKADFIRREYLPWLEWKVKDMNDEQRTAFFETYVENDLRKEQVVLAYLTVNPEHISPDIFNPRRWAASVMDGRDSELGPLRQAVNAEMFPTVSRGEYTFGPVGYDMEEDLGPRNEYSFGPAGKDVEEDLGSRNEHSQEDVALLERRPGKHSLLDGVVNKVRRCFKERSAWLAWVMSKHGKKMIVKTKTRMGGPKYKAWTADHQHQQ